MGGGDDFGSYGWYEVDDFGWYELDDFVWYDGDDVDDRDGFDLSAATLGIDKSPTITSAPTPAITPRTLCAMPILCLLLTRPIGSRRPSHVFMMEPTDTRHFDDRSVAWRLHTSRLGRVLAER